MTDIETASISSQALATVQAPETPDALLARLGVKVKKIVTRTVLQQGNAPIAVTFESAAYEGEHIEKTKMQAARLANVKDLATGGLHLLIMNTVLEGELNRAYPDESYVGRSFLIASHKPIKEGKEARYRVYQIAELDINGETGEVSGEVVADANDPAHEPVNKEGNAPGKSAKTAKAST